MSVPLFAHLHQPSHLHPPSTLFEAHVRNMEAPTPSEPTAVKRKRSLSPSATPLPGPAAKVSKTSSSQLSINYLARQSHDDLPLLNKDDTLSNLLQLLTAYSNVLDRHESLASNLGARPLGPILIKRFERCFDAPPKVVASHHKGGSTNPDDTTHHITWLEVIEFARAHPSQFTLTTFSEGRRVCQFYYPQKQLRVQISEEDFLFINSGRCQELIPPLPIWEDEEKEVGTCDVLENKLRELTNAADMIAARTRQLSHRLKGRRAAILERRAEGGSGTPAKASVPQTTTAPSGSGFVPVNATIARPSGDVDTSAGSLANVRSELLKHFESLPHNQSQGRPHSRHHSIATYADSTHQPTRHVENMRPEQAGSAEAASTASSLSPVSSNVFSHDILNYYTIDGPSTFTTANHHVGTQRPSLSYGGHAPLKHNFSRPLPPALESSQPFRPLCQAHMDALPRGQRVLPPCDRCRRLRMDCVKNLTSCSGCTKKHARCHWRDVSRAELGALDHLMDADYADTAGDPAGLLNGFVNGEMEDDADADHSEESDDDDSNPLEDLEALGEKEEQREKELEERMREDEEGLRNARELARQGREDSIRSAHVSHINSVTAAIDSGSTDGEIAQKLTSHPSDPDASNNVTAPFGGLPTYGNTASHPNDVTVLVDSHTGDTVQKPTLHFGDSESKSAIGMEHARTDQQDGAHGAGSINHADAGERSLMDPACSGADVKPTTAAYIPLHPGVAPMSGGFHAVNHTQPMTSSGMMNGT